MEEQAYEMLWDCAYCGTTKLLGHSQRHCATCGAAQDPSRRYFPSDADKVRVHEHRFVGADVACPACRQPMSRAAACCTSCGSPLDPSRSVATRGEMIQGPGGGWQPAAPPQEGPAASKSGKGIAIVIGLVLLAIVGVVVARLTLKKDTALAVAALTWERTIAIERMAEVRESGPCSSVPRDAAITSRNTPMATCKKRKVDRGDGTFVEKEECSQPVEQCSYNVRRWTAARTLRAGGKKGEPLRWPDVDVMLRGECLGCEREGTRTESFVVSFTDAADKKNRTCRFDSEAKWSTFTPGSKWAGKVNLVGGDLDCDTLKTK